MFLQRPVFRSPIVAAVVMGLLSAPALAVKQVNLADGEQVFASGLLHPFEDQCLLVAPLDSVPDGKVTVLPKSGTSMSAILLDTLVDGIGVYGVASEEPYFCTSLWPDGQRIALLMATDRQAYLDVPRGSEVGEAVNLRELVGGDVEVLPEKGTTLPAILPGALLRIRFSPVAMVVGTAVDGLSLRAVRLDLLEQALLGYLSRRSASASAVANLPEVVMLGDVMDRRVAVRTKLRKAPDAGSLSLKILDEGTLLKVTGRVKGSTWLAVRLHGLSGYLPEADLQQ